MRWGWVECFKELMGWKQVWAFEKINIGYHM